VSWKDAESRFIRDTDQIHLWFDSLLRGYPIGSFLFWNVAPVVVKFTFHQFLRNYHENREPICTQYDPHLGKACLRFLTGNRDSRR
jgi:hypothetical protein